MLLSLLSTNVYANQIKDEDAIKIIIGESEGESYIGKIAVAKTLLNRGNTKGCYGLYAPRVVNHKYSKLTYESAKKAWLQAKKEHPSDWKAMGWGNASDVVIFKKQAWFKKCYIVKTIGNHHFWAVKEV